MKLIPLVLILTQFLLRNTEIHGSISTKMCESFFSTIRNFRYVAIHNHSLDIYGAKYLMKKFDIRLRYLGNLQDINEMDFLLINNDQLDKGIGMTISQRLQKTTLVYVKEDQLGIFKSKLQDFNLNLSMFLILDDGHSEIHMKEVISLTNHPEVIINDVAISFHGYVEKISDFHGLHLKSISGQWWPWIIVKDCENSNQNCQLDGCLIDIFNEAAKLMNVTWSSDITSDWGYIPKDLSVTENYTGILNDFKKV